ncbi:MAG TPA: cysteine synthase family protein [Myxococcales bacterium]|nr:cysteine synthase family protein [Myxococcales bacterium]
MEAVGCTPLLRLRHLEDEEGLAAAKIEIAAKLEFFNPGGSVKDRPALQMVLDAQAAGKLSAGKKILDSTSGNTGVAYAWIGAALGVPVTLVMPENVSQARKQITRAYGAELIFSDPLEGSDGAIRLARQLVERHPDRYVYLDQYGNESNPKAHYLGTGREIWEATAGRVTHFVAGIGTSGTLMGTGQRLRKENPRVQIVGVEPDQPFHGLEGLKHLQSSIVPPIYSEKGRDETLFISTEEGWEMAERLGRREGLLVGHSSGAALAGALRIARGLREAGKPGVIVTVFPDRADRYFEPVRPGA